MATVWMAQYPTSSALEPIAYEWMTTFTALRPYTGQKIGILSMATLLSKVANALSRAS